MDDNAKIITNIITNTNDNTAIITNIPNLLSRILGSQIRLELEYCEEAVQDLVCDIFR